MTNEQNDIDDLISIWKSGETPNSTDFKKRIKFDRLRAITSLTSEVVISVVAFALGLYLCFTGSLVLGVSTLFFSAIAFGISLWARAGTWHLTTGPVKAELLTSIKLARSQYRWAWGGIWVCAVALLFLATMTYTYSTDHSIGTTELRSLLSRFSLALVFVAVNLIITSLLLENARKRLAKLRLLYEQLHGPKL